MVIHASSLASFPPLSVAIVSRYSARLWEELTEDAMVEVGSNSGQWTDSGKPERSALYTSYNVATDKGNEEKCALHMFDGEDSEHTVQRGRVTGDGYLSSTR